MSRRLLVVVALIAAPTIAFVPVDTRAQTMKPGDVSAAASITGVNTFDTDLDRGGDFRWATAIASGSLTHQFTPQLTASVRVRYDYEHWNFGNPVAFGGVAPWTNLNAPSMAIDLSYVLANDISIGVTPVIGWGFESGANTGDALIYGAIVSATRVFAPSFVLGVGAGIVRQIDETKVFPFLIIHWRIDDHWRLANPFPAGPAGGAGIELVYTVDDAWEIAFGGAYRSYRFRLADSGPAPNGVGENRFVPIFARVTRSFGSQTHVDLYAGISVGGRLSVDDATGAGVARDDYKTAPAIGITLAHRL